MAGCHDLSSDCDLNVTCADAGAPADCAGVLVAGTCNECLRAACCDEAAACKKDGACLDCYRTHVTSSAACQASATQAAVAALDTCLSAHCAAACAKVDTCDPVTNDGCRDGAACDLGEDPPPYNFICFPPPFGALLCSACDSESATGPFCDATLTCFGATHTCARFCCTDADCGTGKCELDAAKAFPGALANAGDAVGVCLTGGQPSCDAPAVAPSLGACARGLFP